MLKLLSERKIAMEKYIFKDKLSKKAQREIDKKARKTWGAISPVTRKPQNPKAYHRKKSQSRSYYPGDGISSLIYCTKRVI